MSGCAKMLPFDSPFPPTTGSPRVPGPRLLHGAQRRPAFGELRVEDECGRALAGERDRDAHDDLVESPPDAEEHHQQRDPGAGEEPEPNPSHSLPWYAATNPAYAPTSIIPFEPDVEHTRALGDETPE